MSGDFVSCELCRISRSDCSLLLSSERLVSVSRQAAQAYCLPKANNTKF